MAPEKIIIIGASSGIGREMACIYARQNHLVGVTGRRIDLLRSLQAEFPHNIFTATFDVTGTENKKHFTELVQQLGGLDLLIYNTGYGEIAKQLDLETEMQTTRTNVVGFVEIVNYAFNYFVQQGYGQIALTSSIAALRGNSWAPAYSASKAFMSNYAEGLNIKAQRLKKEIIITDVQPGFIDTKMAKGNKRFWVASPQKAAQQMVAGIAKGKRKLYVTKRWWIIAQLLKFLPFSLYRRLA